MQAIGKTVIFKTGDRFEDRFNTKIGTGVDGSSIILDPTYNPRHHVNIRGTVVSAGNKTSFKAGDIIYFHYNLTATDNYMQNINGQSVFICDNDDLIFCSVKEGVVTMNRNWVMVEPLPDEDVAEFEVEKVKIKGKKVGNIIIPGDEKKALMGKLVEIGNTDMDVKVGSTIYFSPDSEFENRIEGKDYYLMRQEDVLACVNEQEGSK